MSTKVKSPADFVRDYQVNTALTHGERMAKFLDDAARKLPYRYFDKRLVAKVVFALHRVPNQESDFVGKKFSSALRSAGIILARDYGRLPTSDPAEGIRATVDSTDLARTELRKQRRRIRSAVDSYTRKDDLVNVGEIADSKLRVEVSGARKAMNGINIGVAQLPQLPPLKSGDDK